jgi:SRSO17 transposase
VEETELTAWGEAFAAYHARFAPRFARSEARERSSRYLRGLLGSVERKNGWQLAEATGEDHPRGIQRLLYEAVWDADAVREDYAGFVVETFGDPAAVLVLDESGFVKKGTKSVGVARQYSGTAGKVENCQLGVFLAYVPPTGHVLLDRRLYLPRAWSDDAPRRQAARVPEAVTFQTKPELGLVMIDQARAQGVPHAWVSADEGYGGVPSFLAGLEARGERYVVAVPKATLVWPDGTQLVAGPGTLRVLQAPTPTPVSVASVVGGWTAASWHRYAVADGAKGPRTYDWAAARVVASRDGWPGPDLWLLARRSVTDPTDLAYYLAHAPADTPLTVLAEVAGRRWPVEQCFEEAKGETGLDQYEVRGWPSWHRHITLSMLAHGFLASQRRAVGGKGRERRAGLSGRQGRRQRTGSAPAAGPDPAAAAGVRGVSSGVVGLAAHASRARQALPLRPRPAVGRHPAR